MLKGSIRAIVIGIAATAMILAVLAVSRLWKLVSDVEQVKIVEIQPVVPAPEEPPLEELDEALEPEEMAESPQPPIPALELMASSKLEAPALSPSEIRWDSDVGVDVMCMDRAPSALPVKKVVQSIAKPVSKPITKVKAKVRPAVKRKPVKIKAYYKPNELDGLPREIRPGRFTWPRRAKGKSGIVRLKLEINRSGRVSVISALSFSDRALVECAKKLARTSRYTAPKKSGVAVKARFTKTYKLIKPR